MMTHFPWLTTIMMLPFLAALAIPFMPNEEGHTIRRYALGVGVVDLLLMVFVAWQHYDFQSSAFQLTETYAWIPQLHLNWSVGADGLSFPLVLLTGLITTLSILASWKVKEKRRLFYFLMLTMYSAQIGVFVAKDLLMFFFMWELELVPVYILIAIWGGPRRQYAATKFILYTALASIFILLAGMAMAFYGDTITFDLEALALKQYSIGFELAAYAALLVSFGVKLSVFPFHTWLPDAHGEASAPVSMILAGVLLKMGGYGLIRMNIEMLPDAHVYFGPILSILGVINIIYGALTAFGQNNMKRRLACSSISHMGFVLLGISTFNNLGINGAVLQMLSHGLIAASLFFLAGVTYDRTHTLLMDEMSGIATGMPKTFALFTAGSMASLALPGMSGFVGELMIFIGVANSEAYSSNFKIALLTLAAVGLVLTPIYLLSMLREVFFGVNESKSIGQSFTLFDANPREILIAFCLFIPIIGVGFYPKLATQTYDVKTSQIASNLHNNLLLAQSREKPFIASFVAPVIPQVQPAQPMISVGNLTTFLKSNVLS